MGSVLTQRTTLSGLTLGKAWWQKPFPDRYSRPTDPISCMVKHRDLSTRYRAVVMVNGGLTQDQFAKQLKMG